MYPNSVKIGHCIALHLLRSKMTPAEVANAGSAVEVVLS